MDSHETTRRKFLQASGGTFGAAWLALHWPEVAAAAQHAHEAAAAPTADAGFKVLTPAQARDVEAIAAQIVPSGDTPGAREAGVVHFIDAIHAGLYSARAPELLQGLAAFQAAFAAGHPGQGQFADLPGPQQVEYLKGIETTPFFGQLRFLTVFGLLALPSYGGNRDRLGWRLVGFVDRHVWEPPFGHYDREYAGFEPYAKEPRS